MSGDLMNRFEEVCLVVDEVLSFAKVGDASIVSGEQLDALFKKGSQLENFYLEMTSKGLERSFETKMNKYRSVHEKKYPMKMEELRSICDDLLLKFISQKCKNSLSMRALKIYLKYSSQERFEKLIVATAEVRLAFLDISNLAHPTVSSSDIESVLLLEAWSKILKYRSDGVKEIESITIEMLKSKKTIDTLLNILVLKNPSWKEAQKIIIAKIAQKLEVLDKEFWACLLEKPEILVQLIDSYPEMVHVHLACFTNASSKLHYCPEKHEWLNEENDTLSFLEIVSLVKLMIQSENAKKQLEKYFEVQRASNNRFFWESVKFKCLV